MVAQAELAQPAKAKTWPIKAQLHEASSLRRLMSGMGMVGKRRRASEYTPAEQWFAQAVDAWVKGDASNCPLR